MTDEDLISEIFDEEGREYEDVPGDKGGPTKFGITLAELAAYRSQECTADDVRSLTEDEARQIYEARYIQQPGFSDIQDENLRVLAVDWGVNCGPAHPIKSMQSHVGVEADGVLGPVSKAAINGFADQPGLHDAVLADRRAYYEAIVARDPSQQKFLRGWLNRCDNFVLPGA